jgi:enoyl-CoA hydratase
MTVQMEIRERIAVLTLNRPERLNALNYAMVDRLMALLDRIETDGEVRAVILTGSGDQAFSAGADIHEFAQSVAGGPERALQDFVRRGQAMTARLEAFPKPEIRLGMPPTFGGTQRLPRLAGRKRALELLLTGDPFTASHAHAIGLVNWVVPHQDLLATAIAWARRILRHSPLAVSAILAAATRGLNAPIGEGLEIEAQHFARLVPSHDLAEGLAAWQERRPPSFNGR